MKRVIAATAVVIALLALAVVAFVYLVPGGSGSRLSAGSNVEVDSGSGSGYPWASQGAVEGVGPSMAVAGGGDVYAVWVGFSASHPTVYPNSSLQFRTQVLFAASTDGGRTFSPPVQVSNSTNPLSYNCFDPSVAAAPGGSGVYVSYVCFPTQGAATAEVVAIGTPVASGGFDFSQRVVSIGLGFDKPWLDVTAGGTVDLVWDSGTYVYWTSMSPNGSIRQPSFNSFSSSYGWISGVSSFANGTIAVAAYGYSRPGLQNSTINVLFATLSHSLQQGTLPWTDVQDLVVPSAVYRGATESFVPGPSLAVASDGTAYLAFAANDGRSLLLAWLSPGASSWSAPLTLASSTTGMAQTPSLAVSSSGGAVAVAWMSNSTGSWDAYSTVFLPASSRALSPVKVSGQDGFPSGVLTWHGDFTSVAFTSGSGFLMMWSDGRGVQDYYGYGHIYSSSLTFT